MTVMKNLKMKSKCEKCGGQLILSEIPQMSSGPNQLESIMDCTECDEQYFGYFELKRLEKIDCKCY